jgi:Di-haem oxidoreductase, putative peroxidase
MPRGATLAPSLIILLACAVTLAPATGPAGTGSGAGVAGGQEIGDGPAIRTHVSESDCETGALTLDEMIARGRALFAAKFNAFDGEGRPAATGNGVPSFRAPGSAPRLIRTSAPDSNSCAGCHNDPRIGGAGDFVANVFVLAQVRDPVTDSVSADFSDERNTLGMMGSGPIEMLAREMSAELQAARIDAAADAARLGSNVVRDLVAKSIRFGRITAHPDGTFDTGEVRGVNADLVVRPFHQKGVVVSLREFTVNAYNHHHGMQAVERFGRARTGTDDFDEDGIPDELTVGDITAATLFQAALGTPGQVIPREAARAHAVEQGSTTFTAIGCAACHTPSMILNDPVFSEPNPFNPAGTLRPGDVGRPVSFDLTRQGEAPRPERLPDGRAVIRAYTDLKRHDLCDAEIDHFCNEHVVQAGVSTREFLTRKLWDVGSSAPYGHRGDLTTITEAILAHGGEGRAARDAFIALPKPGRDALVEFLKSLQVLPEGTPTLVMREKEVGLDAGAR